MNVFHTIAPSYGYQSSSTYNSYTDPFGMNVSVLMQKIRSSCHPTLKTTQHACQF